MKTIHYLGSALDKKNIIAKEIVLLVANQITTAMLMKEASLMKIK